MKIPLRNYQAWKDDHTDWKLWFAWHPVRINNRTFVWLETVERRFDAGWYYRPVSESSE